MMEFRSWSPRFLGDGIQRRGASSTRGRSRGSKSWWSSIGTPKSGPIRKH